MPKYITAVETARRLGVNEKTVRNWVRAGTLDARKNVKNRLDILATDVDALKRKREGYQDETPDISHLIARLEDLERKYADLEKKYVELTASIAEKVEKQVVSLTTAARTGVHQRSATVVSASVPVDVPDGSIHFAKFAEKYGVPRGTFTHHVKVGIAGDRVATVKMAKRGRPEHSEYWLTPEQQEAAIVFWERHGVKYCSDQ
jgi:DNA-binding transcriptional MerR regulator